MIHRLLKYAASGMPATGSASVMMKLETASAPAVAYVREAGLAPLLWRAIGAGVDQVPPPLRNSLLSADLTAQVRHGVTIEAAKQAVGVCNALAIAVTLLKGISISRQYYPAGHLRPMSDIDLLVPDAARQGLEAEFLRRGYRQGPARMGPDPHHGEPLFDPQRQVWVELHSALFPGHSRLRQGRLFSHPGIAEETLAATLEGQPVGRLSNELQLIYIASYWARDISTHGIHAGFVVPVLDAVCLLTAADPPLNWERLFRLLDNRVAAASLLILLTYLSRHEVVAIPADVLARLATGQDIAGRAERAILQTMVHRYLVGGRPFRPFHSWHIWTNLIQPGSAAGKLIRLPWNILFPASYPYRYNASWQLWRITQRLRRSHESS